MTVQTGRSDIHVRPFDKIGEYLKASGYWKDKSSGLCLLKRAFKILKLLPSRNDQVMEFVRKLWEFVLAVVVVVTFQLRAVWDKITNQSQYDSI